jgi:hypothetical protein
MPKITRRIVTFETIDIPDGFVVCPMCKGKGMLSKYDQGVKSLVHDASLAALEECHWCKGQGYIDEEIKKLLFRE